MMPGDDTDYDDDNHSKLRLSRASSVDSGNMPPARIHRPPAISTAETAGGAVKTLHGHPVVRKQPRAQRRVPLDPATSVSAKMVFESNPFATGKTNPPDRLSFNS